MKKQILLSILFIFLISNFLYSQDTTKVKKDRNCIEKKHEIRICFYNVGTKNFLNDLMEWSYFWDYYPGDYYFDPMFFGNNNANYGLGYTFTFGNNGLRSNVGFNYTKDNNKYKNNFTTYHVDDYSSTLFSFCFSAGYQRNFNFERGKMYLGLDTKFGINSYSFSLKHTHTTASPPYQIIEDESDKTSSYEIGGGPLLGLQYYILPNLSLSVETCINALYADNKTAFEYNDYTSPLETTTSKGNSFNIRIKPLSIISANFHF